MLFGAISAAYVGVVADLDPTARPRMKRAAMKQGQLGDAACQMAVMTAMVRPTKRTQRRPNLSFKGALTQHPISAAEMYGAPLTKPRSKGQL